MQTFLPYKSFKKSAKVLDKKRCWKQCVETMQILRGLQGEANGGGWLRHPAVLMWKGHEEFLKHYFNVFLKVAKEKHGINTKYEYLKVKKKKITKPFWYGKKKFHRGHRARLLEKDFEFYSKHFPKKDKGFNQGRYWWPNMETEKFYIIN